jgi:uncharacterized protein (TIGR03000 family)
MRWGPYVAALSLILVSSVARAQQSPQVKVGANGGLVNGFVTHHGSFALSDDAGMAIYVRYPVDPFTVQVVDLAFQPPATGGVWWYEDPDGYYLGFRPVPWCPWEVSVYFGYFTASPPGSPRHFIYWHLGCSKPYYVSGLSEVGKKQLKKGPRLQGMAPGDGRSLSEPFGEAKLAVLIPTGTKLMINGEPAEAKTGKQLFVAPRLVPGKEYGYLFQAISVRDGKTRTASRFVTVEAGQEVAVDLRDNVLPSRASRPNPSGKDKATLSLILPENAKLMVNGEAVVTKSPTPVFTAPGLRIGQVYHYTLEAVFNRGAGATRISKQVLVSAGDEVQVDLSNEDHPHVLQLPGEDIATKGSMSTKQALNRKVDPVPVAAKR